MATSVLECRCPLEFSSNPNQTHLNKLIKVFRITRDTGRFFSGLELNSAGHRHSRTDVATPALKTLENWVQAFWDGTQMVQVILRRERLLCKYKSQWTSMTCGVPQGSILAPLLFSLYILPTKSINEKEPNCLSQLC